MGRIAEFPKTIAASEQYTAGEVAILYGVSHRTACKMIDDGTLSGFTLPGRRERRVLHTTVIAHVEANPQYSYVLPKIVTSEPSAT